MILVDTNVWIQRNFSVDRDGKLYSDIHVNPWVAGPLLSYVLHCEGAPVTGAWMSMRELPGGRDWYRFFEHQCIRRMKKVADDYTELFEGMVDIFNGKLVESAHQSDIAVALHPLPLVPLLVCYWKPEEGMASDLNVFFDAAAEKKPRHRGTLLAGRRYGPHVRKTGATAWNVIA